MIFVSQDAVDLGLEWYPGDPVSLTWRVAAVNWSGTYTAKLRKNENPSSEELATFTVTATYDAVNLWTTFVVTLATSIPQGEYWWSCKQTGGTTRFSGLVIVSA
jgi:hypothetical protein